MLRELIIVTFVISSISIADSRYCFWSKQTAVNVTSCPKTKQEVKEREQSKNCSSLAFIQNCTDAINFKYHCVINEFGNALIEVCAPEYYIHGFCTEYNVYGAVIQPHYHLKCDIVDPPCANRYISTDAYLYEGCYKVITKNSRWRESHINSNTTVNKPSNISSITRGSRESLQHSRKDVMIVVIWMCLTLILFIGVLILRISKQRNATAKMIDRYKRHLVTT